MEDCGGEEREGPGLRPLQHSASSSASSSSARSLETATPPYTPRSRRRSMESPLALLPDVSALEEEVSDGHNWQETVPPQLLCTLSPREVDRQAVIYELFTTEASHLRTLRVLDQVFFQKMRDVLRPDELSCIFPNLQQVYELHANLCEAMKKRRESPVVERIGDIMFARFEGAAGEEFLDHASQLCSQQSEALELIKNKQRKDPRFAHLIQECEASPHCRRLQLKDLLVSEMQRLTKYPLLLDNIIKHTEAGSPDLPCLQQAQAYCRGILQAVNEVVRETEHRQRLHQYQRRLDAAPQFKSLNLSTKTMIHEGPLTWKVSKEKSPLEVQALLLSDCLVLLQRGPDERLLLRCPSRWLGGGVGGGGDSKTSFSPLIKLDSLLVRDVATDNKALYVISTMERQIYELVAGTSSEKNTWKDLLEKTILLTGGSSPLTNHTSTPISSPGIGNSSPVSPSSHLTSDDSMTERSVSMGTDSSNGDGALTPTTPTDQSGSFLCGDGQALGVAEAALQDVETLRQLIFRDLDEDSWSHDSDNTPTNEAANDRQRPESLETVLSCSTDQWEAEPEDDCLPPPPPPEEVEEQEQRSFQVMRKGNMFYLVMPTEHGESATDDLNDPTTPTADTFPLLPEEALSLPPPPPPPVQPGEEEEEAAATAACVADSDLSDLPTQLEQEVELCHLEQAGPQSHVITNVDEIFQTIEVLMGKLHQLRDIEMAHQELLKTLRESPANQELEEQPCTPTTVSRTPSLDRGSGDGKEGSPAERKIQSTGF